jgi:hypothetical protein
LIDPIELNIKDFSSGKFTREILVSSLVGNSSVVANFQGEKFFTQFSQNFDEAPVTHMEECVSWTAQDQWPIAPILLPRS